MRPLLTVAKAGFIALLAAACGAPAASTAIPTSTTAAATAASSDASWVVNASSKATVKVREQLVNVSLPSDAVLTATGATGSFTLNPDGSFSADSKITFDVTTLTSDQSQRDSFVKMSTLNTRQYPTATFVPTSASGLTLPLPTSGQFSFTLAGKMTIHGTTKDVTFSVTANRNGGSLTAAATANPAWKFEDFGMSAPAVPLRVVSVVDEIRLVVDIVATGPTN